MIKGVEDGKGSRILASIGGNHVEIPAPRYQATYDVASDSAYYKYSYVVSDGTAVAPTGPTVVAGHDLGRPDIHWDVKGNPVIN